ncbi:MAG TPA: heavy metal-binding domain-containing protein [Nitrospiria bacterium]|jgi:uncharacterized protein YbjQ (UPF0145 family)|nr:heavy metal-binding domain-containing protein [Nitrospiria bacterium]
MICPNCGLDQLEGSTCANCQATLPRPLTASEIKAMKAGFEKKEATVPPSAPPPIEFGLTDLEAGSPSQTKSASSPGIEQFQKVLVITSSIVEGRKIVRYGDPLCCQSVVKLDGLDKFLAGIKDVSSLRNTPYGELFKKAEMILMSDLKIEAAKKGANAVIGTSIHYEFCFKNAVMVHANGTVAYLDEA